MYTYIVDKTLAGIAPQVFGWVLVLCEVGSIPSSTLLVCGGSVLTYLLSCFLVTG
jgi:hypothetical protein